MAEEGWIPRLFRFIRSAFKDEVKTPLSFFFRISTVIPILILPLLIAAGVPGDLKFHILVAGLILLAFLVVIVSLFAWFKPKNLVYGESGHRAEFKVEYGTEKRAITHREVVTLEGEPNPKLLPSKQRDEPPTGESA